MEVPADTISHQYGAPRQITACVGCVNHNPPAHPDIKVLLVKHLLDMNVESGEVGPEGNSDVVEPPFDPDGEGRPKWILTRAWGKQLPPVPDRRWAF